MIITEKIKIIIVVSDYDNRKCDVSCPFLLLHDMLWCNLFNTAIKESKMEHINEVYSYKRCRQCMIKFKGTI